jgi:hypothetical protein
MPAAPTTSAVPSAAPAISPGAGPHGPTTRHRLAFVDALRVYAVAMVFVIHVGEVFNPWDEWHITNAARSRVLGEVVVLFAPWIMPLVMLLAGVSAWFALRTRDNGEYALERTRRVLLPLVIGTLLLVPPQVWLERRFRHQFDGSLLAFYPHFFEGIYPRGNFSWHHLWFLAHLYLYSLLALPLFRWLQRPEGARALGALARLVSGSAGLVWLALPLVVERSLLWGLFPERHMLTSDWSNHALLFVAYVYGFVLAGVPGLRATMRERWPRALPAALLGTAALTYGTWRGIVPWRLPAPYSPGYLAFWALYAWCAWAWKFVMLGAGQRWLQRGGSRLHRAEPLAYAWYVVHQPVIVAVAYVVVRWPLGVAAKASTIFVVSAAGTLAAIVVLGAVPWLSALLGGRKRAGGVVPHAAS